MAPTKYSARLKGKTPVDVKLETSNSNMNNISNSINDNSTFVLINNYNNKLPDEINKSRVLMKDKKNKSNHESKNFPSSGRTCDPFVIELHNAKHPANLHIRNYIYSWQVVQTSQDKLK